jgi:hypothetical protein
MDKKQALQFLKSALDEAVSKGAFKNLEYVHALISAFNIISENLKDTQDEVII